MSEERFEQRVEAASQREAWRHSLEHHRAWRIGLACTGIGTLIMIIILLGYSLTEKIDVTVPPTDTAFYFASAFGVFLAGLFGAGIAIRSQHSRFLDMQLLRRYNELTEQQGEILEEEELRLNQLWRLSEDRLRVYHEIATKQANTSFRNAQWAITGGFIVVIAGSCAVFLAKNIATSVVVGTLGAVGAALSAYIGRTFLRLQENAASSLRSYFDQPREQFRYLAAERLLNHITDDQKKANAINEIIRSMAPDHNSRES